MSSTIDQGLRKVGEFCGCPIYIDYSGLAPDEAKMVSLTWDAFEQRMRKFDEVKIVNLRVNSSTVRIDT